MKHRFFSLSLFLALGFFLVYPPLVDAKTVSAVSGTNNIYIGGIAPTSINTTSFSTTYAAEIRNASTNAVIPDNGTVPIGATIKLVVLPNQPISWSGKPSDSPFGKSGSGSWVTSAGPPSSYNACGIFPLKTFTNGSSGGLFSCSWGETYDYYMTASVHPINATVSTTGNMSCGALVGNTATCTVTGSGPLRATFNFPSTYGNFYLNYYYKWSGCIVNAQPRGCYPDQYPQNTPTIPLSAQTLVYTLTATLPPPTTPTGLSAAPSTCGNNWLNLSWNASAGATNYKVYRGVTEVYDGPLLAYSDTGLTLGSTYTYTIEATNAGGTSARSTPAVSGTVSNACNYTLTINTAGTGGGTTTGAGTYTSGASVTATATPNASSTFTGWSGACNASGQVIMSANRICTATFTAIPPPPTPTGLSAAQSTCGNNWLNLSWNASAGATNYKVYRGVTKVYDGPLLAFSDTGLTPGYSYSYTITASNVTGTSGASSPVRGVVSNPCDTCANFSGVQSTVPSGFVQSGGDCVCQ